MARTSALGYITGIRQTGGLGVPRSDDGANPPAWTSTPAGIFFRYLSAPKGTPNQVNNRYREGGGGRDVTLSLKEGLSHDIEFQVFARPAVMGFLLQALTGPGAAATTAGEGKMSNGIALPPVKAGSTPGDTTIAAPVKAGATTITVADDSNFAIDLPIVVGWGANMEFVYIDHDTAPTGDVITLATALKFPHAVGEVVYEINGFGILASAMAVGAKALVLTSDTHGIPSGQKICIYGLPTGGEIGNSEIINETVTVAGSPHEHDLTWATNGCVNPHSAGAIVYECDVTDIATTAIHMFEPVSGLSSSIDYFTIERAVGSDLVERIQDCKLGTATLSGEAPGPIRFNTTWMGRFAKVKANAMTEVYTNQDPITDLPFRMPNGKFVIDVGGQVDMSTKLRQFEWNPSNQIQDDIFTDQIYRDETLDIGREGNFSAQLYYKDSEEFYRTYYGDETPAADSTPSTIACGGSILMEFTISSTKRMNIVIPSVIWEVFPVEVDPEPKAIVVEAQAAQLKNGTNPVFLCSVQNMDVTRY